ncbi:MAG: DUF3102 domain-containing protein [Syntrophobacteraceae bacterium]|jgi:hypothetical protein
MQELEKSRIQEIVELHNQVFGHLKMSLNKAERIGELLKEQKKNLGHGNFTDWIQKNLPFTVRTAQNYMRLHRGSALIKNETVSHLSEAYRLLVPPKQLSIEYRESESILDITLEEWAGAIENINRGIADEQHKIGTDKEWLQRRFGGDEDLTEEEWQRDALALNFMMHFCYYRQLAQKKGRTELPEGIWGYLESFEQDRPGILTEPKTICRECKADFN